jgi:hypothetical protein
MTARGATPISSDRSLGVMPASPFTSPLTLRIGRAVSLACAALAWVSGRSILGDASLRLSRQSINGSRGDKRGFDSSENHIHAVNFAGIVDDAVE